MTAGVIQPRELRRIFSAHNVRQIDVAAVVDCDQGQVSRLLRADHATQSKTYERICRFAMKYEAGIDDRGRSLIDAAVDRCWDGSKSHARRIAAILHALAEYESEYPAS